MLFATTGLFSVRSFASFSQLNLFENITEPLLVVIKDRVSMAIEKYEPRVSVEDVVVQSDDGSNGISIMVSFKINGVEQPVSVSTFLERIR